MYLSLKSLTSGALPRHFCLTVYPDGSIKITERKRPSREPKRDRYGRFTSPYAIRFRARAKGTCAYAAICPFHASTGIEEP